MVPWFYIQHTENTTLNTEKTSEVDLSAISELLIRSDKITETRQKLKSELALAEQDDDVMAAGSASLKLEERIAKLDRTETIIEQRLEAAKPNIDALAERLEDADRQADQEHDRKELAAFNALVDTPEGKQARLFLAAMKMQYIKCNNRYVRFEDTEAFKKMLTLSPEESQAAYDQLVTPPEREPVDPKLLQVRDIVSRMDDLNISAPEPTPVQRPGLTVCPISAEQVKHQKLAQQRRTAAMNAVSNGVATDEDRALLGMDNTDPNNDDELVQEIA